MPQWAYYNQFVLWKVLIMHEVATLLYSWKYWQELNLAVEPKIAIARVLADLNLVVRYWITIPIYVSRKFWRILIWWL